MAAERHAERQLLWGVDDGAVYRGLQHVYREIIDTASKRRVLSWRKKFVSKDFRLDWLLGTDGVFTKSYPLNRLLGTILMRPEFADLNKFHKARLVSVEQVGAQWKCNMDGAGLLVSDFPPIVRHGIETPDVDVDDYDRNALD